STTDQAVVGAVGQSATAGREFWLTFLPYAFGAADGSAHVNRYARELTFTATEAAVVTVEVPGASYISAPISVAAGGTATFLMPVDVLSYIYNNDTTYAEAIRVTSDVDIAVFATSQYEISASSLSVIPTPSLGTEYVVVTAEDTEILNTNLNITLESYSRFAVVATEDNTTVYITPPIALNGVAAGTTHPPVVLDRGEVYHVRESELGADLSGTIVTADKNIAVVSGNEALHPDGIAYATGASTDAYEMLRPTSSWGNRYFINPLDPILGDKLRIASAADGTEIYFNGSLAATIDRGDVYESRVKSTVEVTGSNPISVVRLGAVVISSPPGSDFLLIEPPFMTLPMSVDQFLTEYRVATPPHGVEHIPQTDFDTHILELIAPTASLASIEVNGIAVDTNAFTVIPNTGYSVAQDIYNGDVGVLEVTGDDPFGLTLFGYPSFTFNQSYEFTGGGTLPTDGTRDLTRTYVYDTQFSQLIEATDELGRKTVNTLDAYGNVVATRQIIGEDDTDPANTETDDLVTTYTYTEIAAGDLIGGLVDTMTDPLGRTTDYVYDFELDGTPDDLDPTSPGFGLLRQVIGPDPDGTGPQSPPVTSYEYDAAGNTTAVVDPLGRRTEFTYDDVGRVLSTLQIVGLDDRDPGNAETDDPLTQFVYDARGNLLETTDPLGRRTTYQYDAMDRLVKTVEVDPDGHNADGTGPLESAFVTTYAYDADDNLTALTDPRGNTTTYTYDARDRLLTETDPLGSVTTYVYDAADNLIEMTDRLGRVTRYTYDEVDRLTEELWLDVDTTTVLNDVDYAYDRASRLTAVEDDFSSFTYTYDDLDRVTQIDQTGTPGLPDVVLDYTYDLVGNVLSVTDTVAGTAGATTAYLYDDLDRVTRITQDGVNVEEKRADYVYDVTSQLKSISRFADIAGTLGVADSEFTYDDRFQLTDLDHKDPADAVLAFYDFTYDDEGRITRLDDIDGATDYAYDDRDQLTGADRDAADTRGDEDYEYDINGNRINTGYQNGANNRLLSDGTYNYAYDDEGNRTKKTEIATGKYETFAWDHRNRLIGVSSYSSGGILLGEVSYTYDVFGRLITRDRYGSTGLIEDELAFAYDGNQIILTFDGAGTQESRFLWGP
ncbi:MAG: hypothetical protein AAGJ97_06060, partial [Planctomycetota bacterium]